MDSNGLGTRLKDAKAARRGFLWLARRVEDEQARAVKALRLKGVYSTEEQRRRYPNGALAAHVLGFVGLDAKGLAGVEQVYNAALTGEEGKLLLNADAKRRPFESEGLDPRDGQTRVLTTAQTVQYIVE